MSSAGFARFPVFEPGRSAVLAASCIGLALAALGALLVAQTPWWLKFVGIVAVSHAARRVIRPGPARPVSLRRLADGRWSLRFAGGRTVIGELHRSCVAHEWLCVAVLVDGWRRVSVAIPADSLPGDEHRRLRVWLRWAPKASARPSTPW